MNLAYAVVVYAEAEQGRTGPAQPFSFGEILVIDRDTRAEAGYPNRSIDSPRIRLLWVGNIMQGASVAQALRTAPSGAEPIPETAETKSFFIEDADPVR